MFYIIVPHINNPVPTLKLLAIDYYGDSTVKVSAGYNDTYVLFEFDQINANYWAQEVIYGRLSNVIIPANGQLSLVLEPFDYNYQVDHSFSDYGLGLFMSPNYPY